VSLRISLRLGLFLLAAILPSHPPQARAVGLDVDSLVAVALRVNPDLHAARAEVEAARGRWRQARALEPPAISYEVGKLGTDVSSEEREAELRLSQALPFPGQRARAGDVGRLDVALAEAELQSVSLRVQGDVTRSYRRLQAARLALRALDVIRTTAGDLEELTQVRLRSGTSRYLDVLRARAERVRLENDLLEAERLFRENRLALAALVPGISDESIDPPDSLAFTAIADSLPALLERARQRPRLLAARLAVERAASAAARARAERLPTAELSAGIDRVPGSDSPGWGGGITLTLPFLPWTDRGGRVSEATAVQAGAEARLIAVERDVGRTVMNAFATARTAEQQVLRFQGLLLDDAQDAVRAAVQNYQAGLIDGLELFETLRTFRSVQLEYIRALLNYELARIDLLLAE
jgi:cobalt-zinc-cadmium efflux system outer membrane protein